MKLNYHQKQKIAGYFFLLPSALFLVIFLLYPFALSIVRSFTNWDGFNANPSFVGLKNYVQLFTNNPDYWASLKINLQFAVVTTTVQTILGFLLAFVVYYLPSKWQTFYKVALYIPVILPASVIAVMWRFMLNPDTGLVNTILRLVGLGKFAVSWLGQTSTAMPTVMAVNTWQYIGFTMVLFYIAMQNISVDVLESASIDGAHKGKLLWHFFIPLTMGTTTTNVILSITGGMKSFALFYMLTSGGPGNATRVVSMRIFTTAFTDFKFYRALAMATVLFFIILILTAVSRSLGDHFNYELAPDESKKKKKKA